MKINLYLARKASVLTGNLNRAIIASLPFRNEPSPIGVTLPFRVCKVQSDGNLHFVEATQSFDEAKKLVSELGEVWPGDYIIDNEETGERLLIHTKGKTAN